MEKPYQGRLKLTTISFCVHNDGFYFLMAALSANLRSRPLRWQFSSEFLNGLIYKGCCEICPCKKKVRSVNLMKAYSFSICILHLIFEFLLVLNISKYELIVFNLLSFTYLLLSNCAETPLISWTSRTLTNKFLQFTLEYRYDPKPIVSATQANYGRCTLCFYDLS